VTQTTPIDETPAAGLAKSLWRPILLLQPERLVHPPSWLEHIPFAFWLMDVLRPRLFVELGTHSGNSYAALAQAARHLGLRTAGYAVDTWTGDPQAGFYPESVYEDFKAWHDRRYASFSTLVRSTFDEALRHFEDGAIDLLNIDGYHTADAVRHDVDSWLPKVSDRGVVLMHDINVRERDFGAWQVWEEVRQRYPSLEFLHGHGLGVLGVGAHLPEELRRVFDAVRDEAGATAVREFFARLGALAHAQYRAEAAEGEARALGVRVEAQRVLAGQLAAREAALDARLRETSTERTADAERADRAEAEARELGARLSDAEAAAREASGRAAAAEGAAGRYRAMFESERAARQSVETAAGLATTALASTREQVAGLSGRLRHVWRRARPAPQPAGRMGRVWNALRALELTPGHVARRPRRAASWVRLLARPRLLRNARLVTSSGLFDAVFYRAMNPDVARSGASPLLHFLTAGGAEGRSPSRLFDAAWYRAVHGDVAASGANPLVHYLTTGAREGRDPHPLFSSAWYLRGIGQTAATVNPLQHYHEHGAAEGRSPHPLFDPGFYVERYGEAIGDLDPFTHFVMAGETGAFNPHPLFDAGAYCSNVAGLAGSGVNPLVHYLRTGWTEGIRPHPLFDPRFYLNRYQDVAAAGTEPLTHFVVAGGREGRSPIPEFDAAWYLAAYPDVAATGVNPLEHFIRTGWLEGRNPSPSFDTLAYLRRYPDVLASGAVPLQHYIEHGRAEGRNAGPEAPAPARALDLPGPPVSLAATNLEPAPDSRRIVVCLSHVLPVSPRAGNEYRIHRLLRWLASTGVIVIPIVAPNDGSRPGAAEVRAMADAFGNAVLCLPDGTIEYLLRDVPDVLRGLDGTVTTAHPTAPELPGGTGEEDERLRQLDRSFCTDALIDVLLRLESVLPPHVLLAEYIWMSRALPLVRRDVFKIIDTIDVFSSRAETVDQYGVADLAISPEAERQRLVLADLLVAIQTNERRELETLAPGIPVVTSGIDFDVLADGGRPEGRQVLCVASGNPMNRRGLRDFVRYAWPRVRARVPGASLLVAGDVGEALPFPPDGVTILGRVADLDPLYAQARAVINPAAAGTGVKVKTLEALAHLRPIVTWPNGVDGLSPGLAGLCRVATDWHGFADQLAGLLEGEWAGFSDSERALLARESDPAFVYAELGAALDGYFSRVARR
jgi:hypothetical protein